MYNNVLLVRCLLPTGITVFEAAAKTGDKRKKVKGGAAGEIETFLGPWAKYADEKDGAKPSEVI